MSSAESVGRARRRLRSLNELVDRRVDRRIVHLLRGDDGEAVGDPVVAELRRQVIELTNRQRSFELLLDGTGRGSARMPSPGHLAKLAGQIAAMTGDVEVARRNVHSAFRVLVAMESLGVGRIAGDTMDVCGKLASVPLLTVPNDDVLEVGTLYGLFAAAMIRMLERVGREPSMTVVDATDTVEAEPGDGPVQPGNGGDTSGTPVDVRAVRTNLALAGAAGAAARVHVGRGADGVGAIRAAAADREYGLIVLAGGRTEHGATADLAWAEQIVATAGIVVVDGYADDNRPGIRTALDSHLAAGSRLTYLGRVAASGYLRAD